MSDSKKTKGVYKNLPQKLREIIASPELNEIIGIIGKENNLDNKGCDVVAKVVVDFLMEASNREELRAILFKELGGDQVLNQKVFDAIDKKILNNLDYIYTYITKNSENEAAVEIETVNDKNEEKNNKNPDVLVDHQQEQVQSSIGNSFERIILNQAKAMQPARLASESVAGGPAREAGSGSQQPAPSSRVPDNLPTEDLQPKPTTPNYSGQDPYREPVE